MNTCPNCGAQIKDADKFCTECGARLDRDSAIDTAHDDLETTHVEDLNQTRVLDYSEQKTLESASVAQQAPNAENKVRLGDQIPNSADKVDSNQNVPNAAGKVDFPGQTSVLPTVPNAQQRVYLNQDSSTGSSEEPHSASSSAKNRKKLLIGGCIAGGVVLIAIIALVIFFVFFQPNNSQDQTKTETQTSVTENEAQEESTESEVAESAQDKSTSSAGTRANTTSVVHLSASEIISRPTFTMPFDSASASSSLEPSSYGTYYASNVMDNDASTAWAEGVAGSGIGSTITLSNYDGSSVSFNQFCMNNGYGKSDDLYVYNNRPSQVTLIADGVERYAISLKDTDYFQGVDLPTTLTCKQLTIRIDSVYNGTRYEDCCISDISLNYF